MQKLLNYTLQLIFYLHGSFALLLSLRCFFISSKNASIFFITFILSLIIGYFFKPLFYNNKFKEKNLAITILLSWLLLILVSAIPLFSYMDIFSISDIFFISTSFVTTTGFHHKLLVNLNYSDALNIWCSFIQMLGGLLSILSYILFFLILFNKHNKFVVFNKSLVIKFIIYYFAVFFLYILILNFSFQDPFNGFMMASSIISTGGNVGTFGPMLGYYFSNNNFLIIYSLLLVITIFLLPIFLFIQNHKVLNSLYINVIKRSLFPFFSIVIILIVFFRTNSLTIVENLFLNLSFITTTGILPYKLSNIVILQQIFPLFFIFLSLIFIGSFSGSTSGGLKIDKLSIIFIKIKEELEKLTLSHKIYGIELIKKGFNQKELNSLFSLMVLGGLFVSGTIIILTATGYTVFDSFVLALAALTNSGEGFLYINDVLLKKNSFTYLILNFLMVFGRFEVIGYLLIFQKFYIRN